MSQVVIPEDVLIRFKTIALIVSEGGLEAFAGRTLAASQRSEKPFEESAEPASEESAE